MIHLIGRIAVETKFIQPREGQRGCLRFRLAVRRNYINKEGERETDFIDVVYWTNYWEKLLPCLTIGKLIAVSGRIITRSYAKEDGTRKYVTEVEEESIDFLERKQQNVI